MANANELQQQFEEFKRVGNMFRGFMQVSETLAGIGSIEQAVSEAEGRLNEKRSEEARWQDKAAQVINDAKAAADELKKNADLQLAQSLAQGASHVRNAQGQAATIISEAQAKASTIIAEAHSAASARVSDAQTEASGWHAQIPQAKETVGALTRQIAEKESKISDLDRDIAVRDKQLQEINTKLSELRAKF